MVVKSAFGWHEAAAGGIGAAILNGFQARPVLQRSRHGSAPNAAASATPYPPHPASQGYVQMAGVFIDTLLICTASAAIILLAGPQEGEGIMLVQNALTSQVGDWGRYFLAGDHFVLRLHLDRRQLLLCRELPGIPRAQPPWRAC